MKEIWKDIKGYEGLYQVSNLGRVKSLAKTVIYCNGKVYHYAETIMKLQEHRRGYLKVGLKKDGLFRNVFVHRLVANAFIPNSNNLSQVNHIDENPKNNRVDNLEWCDCQYNVDYSLSKPVCQYDMQGNLLAVWKSMIEVDRVLGIPDTNIGKCCKGIYKQAGGYVWRYCDKKGGAA